MPLQADLFALEEQFWTGGPGVWRAHCDDDCLVVFPGMSGVMSREDIANTAEEGRWRDVEITPKGFVELGEDAAVIGYACRATRKDGAPHAALVTSAYVRRDDGWKLASHQQGADEEAKTD